MTDENVTKTFRFTVTWNHAPHILAPFTVTRSSQGSAPSNERYSIRIPALDDYPGCRVRDKDDGLGPMVAASCNSKPVIIVGSQESPLEYDYWAHLEGRATAYKYPINRLLHGRDITVAVRMIKVTNQFVKNQDIPWIVAVRIEGDLDSFREDKGLEAHIDDIMRMLDHD